MRTTSTTTIRRSADDLYRAWHEFSGLPDFMIHLVSVSPAPDGRTHWVARAPGGRTVEWDAEIVEDVPGRRIAWRSVNGTPVTNAGAVTFRKAPRDQGTEVSVEVDYSVPGGQVGAAVSRLFGESPGQQVADDLRRFKQLMETGEITRSAGSPQGTAAGNQLRQHPANPSGVAADQAAADATATATPGAGTDATGSEETTR